MALIDGLDDEKLTAMKLRFCARLDQQTPGTKDHWIWAGKVVQVRYCLGEDLTSSLLYQSMSGFACLQALPSLTRALVLFEIWHLVWQLGDPSLLSKAAQATDVTDYELWESKVYADFVLRGISPEGSPPIKGLSAALVLPPKEAVGLLTEKVTKKVAATLRARDTGRAVAALGPLGWIRGVAWARRSLDGCDIVPSDFEHLFYGFRTL